MLLRGLTVREKSAIVLPDVAPSTGDRGIDLATTVWPDTAARSVTEALEAASGAAQSGNIKEAIAAHLAIEEEMFGRTLHRPHKALAARLAD